MISASLMKETAMSSGFFVIIFSPVGFQMWAESLTGDLIGAVLIRSEQKWQRIWKASPLLHHIQIKLVSFRNKKSMFDCKGGIQVICHTPSADPLISFNLFWTCRGRSVCRWGRCFACPLQAGDRWKTHAAGGFFGWSTGLQAHQTPLLWFRGSGVCEKERNILYSWPGQLPAGGQPQVWKKKKITWPRLQH